MPRPEVPDFRLRPVPLDSDDARVLRAAVWDRRGAPVTGRPEVATPRAASAGAAQQQPPPGGESAQARVAFCTAMGQFNCGCVGFTCSCLGDWGCPGYDTPCACNPFVPPPCLPHCLAHVDCSREKGGCVIDQCVPLALCPPHLEAHSERQRCGKPVLRACTCEAVGTASSPRARQACGPLHATVCGCDHVCRCDEVCTCQQVCVRNITRVRIPDLGSIRLIQDEKPQLVPIGPSGDGKP